MNQMDSLPKLLSPFPVVRLDPANEIYDKYIFSLNLINYNLNNSFKLKYK